MWLNHVSYSGMMAKIKTNKKIDELTCAVIPSLFLLVNNLYQTNFLINS